MRCAVLLLCVAACAPRVTFDPKHVPARTDGSDGGCALCQDASVRPLPDLVVDERSLARSVGLFPTSIGSGSCALQEGCVGAPGDRRLLRFTVAAGNIGDADLVVGDPADDPRFELSACHGHRHFSGFASYQLLDGDGGVVALGRKQAFCLSDTGSSTQSTALPKFNCEHQGLTAGWHDTYAATLDCQWIDVTDVPPGDYRVRVEVNPDHVFEESNFSNNTALAAVTIPPTGECVIHQETCHDGRDQDCDGVVDNGCAAIMGNDTCENAFPVEDGVFAAQVGPAATLTSSCAGESAAYFSFQLAAAELVFLSSHGSEGETSVVLLDGSCAVEHACVTETCSAGSAHLLRALEPGDYTVAVTGAPGSVVQLKLTRAPCTDARVIPGVPSAVQGNTAGRANTTGTSCGTGDGPDEHFVLVTCPGAQQVRLSTCGSTTFDSVIQVRPDSCRASGLSTQCNDDGFPFCTATPQSSTLGVALAGNTLYFITVDGFDPDDSGTFTLNVTPGP